MLLDFSAEGHARALCATSERQQAVARALASPEQKEVRHRPPSSRARMKQAATPERSVEVKVWFLVVFIMGADGVTPEVTGQTFASPDRVLERWHERQGARSEACARMGLQPDGQHGRGRGGAAEIAYFTEVIVVIAVVLLIINLLDPHGS